MKLPEHWLLGAVFAVLTALSWISFPGHTYLISDTQIYVPLFEHLENSRLLPGELILTGAHLSFTIYDEVTLGLRSLTGLDWEWLLFAQQWLFRWIGYWGIYWLARSSGLGLAGSVLTSAVMGLGAFVYGPSVITVEYEPVPRGFAVPLLMAALGSLALDRPGRGGMFAGLAFLYHAPATWPILLIAVVYRRWKFLLPVVGAMGLLAILAAAQTGSMPSQPFFSVIDEATRKIQQIRAPYNWVSLWPAKWIWLYPLSAGLTVLALRRIGNRLPEGVRPFLLWMQPIGLLTIPLTYVLLEKAGWALLPQLQPGRAVLYCHLFCQFTGMVAAALEMEDKRPLRAFLWLIAPLSLALNGDVWDLWTLRPWQPAILLGLTMAGLWCYQRWPRPALVWAGSLLVAVFCGEAFGARNYIPLETPELTALSRWAEGNTPLNATFLFPDLGRRAEPGIFRARAERTVYVCWKQGGQVNYFPAYAKEWWARWREILVPGHAKLDYEDLRRRGIDVLVLTKDQPKEPLPLLHTEGKYRVYALRALQ